MNTEQAIQDILEMVTFLHDNAMTKSEGMTKAEGVTKKDLQKDLQSLEQSLVNRMDEGFANIHTELRSIGKELEDIKNQLERTLQKLQPA